MSYSQWKQCTIFPPLVLFTVKRKLENNIANVIH